MERMIKRIKKHWLSFGHALCGLNFVLGSQPNFLVHLLSAVLVVLAGVYFKLTSSEWLTLVLTIFLVFITETINTGLELITDALKEHQRSERDDFYIGLAKDVGAGAVLLASIGAVIVGLVIFLPKVFLWVSVN